MEIYNAGCDEKKNTGKVLKGGWIADGTKAKEQELDINESHLTDCWLPCQSRGWSWKWEKERWQKATEEII